MVTRCSSRPSGSRRACATDMLPSRPLPLSCQVGLLLWFATVSALGLVVPCRAKHSGCPESLLSAMSAGVLISLAWLHLLDDAQDQLEGLTHYPAANAAAVVGALATATTQVFPPRATEHKYTNREPLLPEDGQLLDPGIVARFHALEASISLHSVLIGLGVGFAQMSLADALVLGLSLSVHQFSEGVALGVQAKRSQLSSRGWHVTFLVFTLALPLGCAAAMVMKALIANVASSTGCSWVLGLLNAFAAGVLTYIGLEMVNHELKGAGTDDGPLGSCNAAVHMRTKSEKSSLQLWVYGRHAHA